MGRWADDAIGPDLISSNKESRQTCDHLDHLKMTALLELIKPPRALMSSLFQQPRSQACSQSLVGLVCQLETSPTVLLGDPDDSLSSLIKGKLLLTVNEDTVEIDSIYAVLQLHILQKKPFKRGCKDCKQHSTELKRCEFITGTTALDRGIHEFPFSYQVSNDASPSMDTPLVSISYEFIAKASVRSRRSLTKVPKVVTLQRYLTVARSLSVPSSPSYSRRIFPAAGIEVGCHFNTAIDPTGPNKVSLTLNGLVSHPGNGENVHIWRLWKGSWRLEESVNTTALPCGRHAHDAMPIEPENRSKVCVLGEDGMYDGWKSDDNTGTLDMEFNFAIKKRASGGELPYTNDTGSVGETEVSHSLAVELVLVKEHYPKGRPDLMIRTGVARILQSQHRVVLSHYTRPSTSSAEECLPDYRELCPSPPVYLDDDEATEETAF
ncbi:hypothetical protein FZEAL_5017 [Fusarium zealandicum]|uniref:LDB19 N-terminal domain-containing protein n=1 Tax=Fusarium zealandicum TaxID=1053134 RepID=A0A8H4ULB3_9HYPO|nr:hypothetical protein FZEAL_5017 [Fusarium zealandicum]